MLVDEFRRRGIDHELAVLPCGHYSTGVTPFKWLDGLTLCRFLVPKPRSFELTSARGGLRSAGRRMAVEERSAGGERAKEPPETLSVQHPETATTVVH